MFINIVLTPIIPETGVDYVTHRHRRLEAVQLPGSPFRLHRPCGPVGEAIFLDATLVPAGSLVRSLSAMPPSQDPGLVVVREIAVSPRGTSLTVVRLTLATNPGKWVGYSGYA